VNRMLPSLTVLTGNHTVSRLKGPSVNTWCVFAAPESMGPRASRFTSNVRVLSERLRTLKPAVNRSPEVSWLGSTGRNSVSFELLNV